MAIDRKSLISFHNPVLTSVDTESPLTIGNGEFAFTSDITGLQTLYSSYTLPPLCTMSQWGWHTTPGNDGRTHALEELEMTAYCSNRRTVYYPVERTDTNSELYDWLRVNPHRLNLARITFLWEGSEINSQDITPVRQELDLYSGILTSTVEICGFKVHTVSACHPKEDALSFSVTSSALASGHLSVALVFPYGSPDISASDWKAEKRHSTAVIENQPGRAKIRRTLDDTEYYTLLRWDGNTAATRASEHCIVIPAYAESFVFSAAFTRESRRQIPYFSQTAEQGTRWWQEYWETGAILRLRSSKDRRACELERRIILSLYLLAIQSCCSSPPQETGLTCNSWYGKFHLEMHPWHTAFLPLWGRGNLLKPGLDWYRTHLGHARENASRNGYKGARWPKMTGPDALDSPSPIAPLLIWQQPHIIFMLCLYIAEIRNRSGEDAVRAVLEEYWEVIEETAAFMCDFTVFNSGRGCFELLPPIMPVQEEYDPCDVRNPAFEVEYWSFALNTAAEWAGLLNKDGCQKRWKKTASGMAEMPAHNGLYTAHENCPETFTRVNRDHPSMTGALGLLPGIRTDRGTMNRTVSEIIRCWNFESLWGWDFAMLAMSLVRLGRADEAVDMLLMDSPKNTFINSGNNFQRKRMDLPLYLPGNGSLLLAASMMTAGFRGQKREYPGFPDDGSWCIEVEDMLPFPY